MFLRRQKSSLKLFSSVILDTIPASIACSQNQQRKGIDFLEGGSLPVVGNNSRHGLSKKDSCPDPLCTWSSKVAYFNIP